MSHVMGKKWKKGKGSLIFSVEDDEARLRLRHKFLIQDYKQLWMETETKKKRLMISTKKKLELLTEIKFLRKKLKSFSENPSQTRSFKLNIQCSDDTLSSLQSPILEEPTNSKEDDLNYEFQGERESNNAIVSQMADLNQIYLPINDDNDANKPKGSSMPADVYLANGMCEISAKDTIKLLKGRNAKNGENRVKWSNPIVSVVHHLPLH